MIEMSELLQKSKPVILYGIFGILTTLVNVAVYYLFYERVGLSNLTSTVVAWFFAVLFAFVTNKMFVFDSKSWKYQMVVSEVLKFFGCRLGTGCIEVGMMVLFVDMLHFSGTIMKLITNFIVIVLNYVLSKLIIFRKVHIEHEV